MATESLDDALKRTEQQRLDNALNIAAAWDKAHPGQADTYDPHRLWIHRAVLLARALLKRHHQLEPHLRWDSKRHPKYRLALFKANAEEVPHDEPVFLVRGRDPLSAPIVRQYADLVRPVIGDRGADDLLELAAEIEAYADKRLPNDPRGEGGDNG